MIRWIAALGALLCLGGCVTTEYVYRDRVVHDDRYAYDDGYTERRVYRDGSWYSPSYSGYGDYYSSPSYGWSYYDYPAYYSVFWPLHRAWWDPYHYPSYYYGVTYFPRNYLSIGFGYGPRWSSFGWPYYSSWYYSPYRYSWADNYYDWRPYYYRGHQHRYAPRFGSARHEAERLSQRADAGWDYGRTVPHREDRGYERSRDEGVSDAVRRTPYGTYGTTRSPSRDADYGRGPAARGEAIGQGGNGRLHPGTRGFGVPVDAREGGDTESQSMRELRRESLEQGLALPGPRERAGYQRYSRDSEAMQQARSRRGYDAGEGTPLDQPRGGWTTPRREYAAPARSYEAAPIHEAPSRGYDAGPAPAPRFESAPAPSFREPAPSFEPSPRSESRGADYGGRSGSRGDSGSRGEVRRVGSNRED